MKQKIVICYNADEFKRSLEMDIALGWFVQSIAVNPTTPTWMGVLTSGAL